MKIKTKRQGEILECNYLVIYIGDDRYRISKSIDNRLCINKTSDGDTDLIRIHPRSGNEIEIN